MWVIIAMRRWLRDVSVSLLYGKNDLYLRISEKIRFFELIKNEGLRKELGKNGRSKAEREFTLDTMLDKYEKLLQEVLA